MFEKIFYLAQDFYYTKNIVLSTKYFHGFVIKINTFDATECHLNPIENTNIRNFTFCLIKL